jgi:type VI secretion system protein ImpI
VTVAVGVRVQDSLNNQVFDRVFPRLPVRIGRNALNDLLLEQNFVSQFHAVLELQGGQLALRDLGSTNGTLLKGGRVPPNQSVFLAHHGFEFAILNLVFRVYSPAEEAPAPSAPQRPLSATTMFKSVADDQLRDQALLLRLAPRIAAMREPLETAKKSIDALLQLTNTTLGEIPPEARGGFVRQIVALLPSIEHEPRFRAMLADHGVALHVDPKTSPQELALSAVREMAIHYLPSVGAPSNAEEVAQFISKLNETINVFLKCFVPLKDGHRQFETEFALRQPQRGPADPQAAVENARDADELAMRLLDWRDTSFEASRAVESVFADIMIHQVAMLNGVMMGVKSLLFELSPSEIERVANDPKHKAGLLQGHHRALWKVYEQRHGDLADDQKRLFSVLFGREFGQAYRGLAGGEQRTKPDGTPVAEGSLPPGPDVRSRGPGQR